MARRHVARWGNSLAVRITRDEAKALGWEENTALKVSIAEGKLIAETEINRRRYTLEELLEGLTPESAHAGEDDGTDRPVGEEIW